jgi:putative dimethyl sulfoxide reductase chaperone
MYPTYPITNQWRINLSGELLVFGLLGKILYHYPDQEFIQELIDKDVFEDIPFGSTQPYTTAGLKLLAVWQERYLSNPGGKELNDLQTDYTRLFLNTGDKPISPWESVYFSEDRSLFQERTLAIRSFYRRFGLQIVKLHQEPDDHIALEFAFLSHLAGLSLNAIAEGNEGVFQNILQVQRDFLTEHVLQWVPLWCDQIEEHAKTDFYRGTGLLVRGSLAELVKTLKMK